MPIHWILALFQDSACTPDLCRIAHFAAYACTFLILLATLGSGRLKLSHLELLRNKGDQETLNPIIEFGIQCTFPKLSLLFTLHN